MKNHRKSTWIVLLLTTSTLTGAPPPLIAEVRPPAGEIARPGPADGCGAEAAGALDLTAAGPRPYAREVAEFAVRFRGEVSPYRLTSLFALPGEEIGIGAVPGGPTSRFAACAEGGELTRQDDDEWTWRAPSEPGLYPLYLHERNGGGTLLVNAFVMVPYAGEDRINGFRIGRYERVPLDGNPAYRAPRGMVEVTAEMADVWLSPHFQLGQFLCKQASEYPKYLVVSERLLLELESLLDRANERGIAADTFAVLSAYRTPHYNQTIGNETRYSRHLYGDAVDIYVDRDGDGRMDDLNGDGRSDDADARVLAAVVEDGAGDPGHLHFEGGLGIYGPAPHRGAFIHVDTRGFRVRWSS